MNKILIYITLVLFAFTSCNKDKEGDAPCTLSHKSVNIKVGENAIVKVIGSKSFSVMIDHSIANAIQVDKDIIVEGVAEGKTTLTVLVGNRQLSCAVTVMAKATEGGEEDKDYAKELENNALRVTGSGVDLSYENPGILFSKSNVNGIITYTAVVLDKNEYISFSVLSEIYQTNGEMTLSTIRSTSLNISKINSATILKQEEGIIWLKIEYNGSKSLLWVFEK